MWVVRHGDIITSMKASRITQSRAVAASHLSLRRRLHMERSALAGTTQLVITRELGVFSTSDTLHKILDAAERSTRTHWGASPNGDSRFMHPSSRPWTISIMAAAKLQ